MARKQKVLVLGGGMSGITAAYELTATAELRSRYDVTVHQFGWRLGGKCASGRNADHHDRIEEHGLHVWFGFYENAFRVMRDAYRELGRPPGTPLAGWRDAFKPADQVVLYEEFDNRWKGWAFDVPPNPFTPGDAIRLPHFWDITHTMLDFLLGQWGSLKATNPHVAGAAAAAPLPSLPFGLRVPSVLGRLTLGIDRLVIEAAERLLRWAIPHPEKAILEALRIAEQRSGEEMGSDAELEHRSFLFDAIDAFKHWLWRFVVQPNLDDDDLRLFFTMFDAGTTMLEGIIEDKLIENGFDAANDEDLREWLRRHGAYPITVDESPFVRGLYDMAFGYKDGDIEKPDVAAGTCMHDMLRLFFTYRGSFMWKMQAGMGDTVFTPFYEVLKRRGVKFEFFSYVSRLGLSEDRNLVDEVDVIRQLHLKHPGEYHPLTPVKGLGCWPSEPDWDQITDEDRHLLEGVNLEWDVNPLKRKPETLRLGEDFDQLVLAIPVAALPEICGELIADKGNPDFKTMIDNSHTVMTQAFQVWLNRPVPALKWPFREGSIMTAYVEPLDTYANMTHLLPRESWPPEANAQSIGYFCGVLKDESGDTQKIANERARAGAIEFLARDAKVIWPNSAGRPGSFDWNLLVGGDGKGPDSFDSQYWLGNFQKTERYTITPSGSVKHRLAANQSGYENLFLAGDWIKTGLDAGCVEAAVMSGMQASRAISGSPRVIVGEDQRWLGGVGPDEKQPPDSQYRLPGEAPPYVNYGGIATCPSPVDCDDSKLYSFFLEADHDKLDAICERVFSDPSGGEFDLRPLGSHVMLSFGECKKIKPRLAPWSEMGFASEKQVAFWIPVVALRQELGIPVAASLGWFIPYIWVDNPLSLAGGREIYGYNKNWGWIDLPGEEGSTGFNLAAYGGNFGVGEPASKYPLIEMAPRGGGELMQGEELWHDLGGLVTHVQRELTGGSDFVGLSGLQLPDAVFESMIGRGGPPQIFLKQFRSVSDGERASFQQITDGGSTVKSISGRPLLGGFDFELHQLDSHPVAEELGVKPQQTVDLAFEVDMDFVLDDGRVLWQGATRSEPSPTSQAASSSEAQTPSQGSSRFARPGPDGRGTRQPDAAR